MANLNPIALSRVEAAERTLGKALQQGSGAQFAWLLAMWQNQAQELHKAPPQEQAEEPVDVLQGYTAPVAEALGQALQQGQAGVWGMMLSWLEHRPQSSSSVRTAHQPDMAQLGLLSMHPVLREVQESRLLAQV
ncbi:hypothetical protein [Balneatrix alpica]|uniref:hypothetical protein n=1 Tax=Balneatrix alpica TaxID=75684 RepID=UPI0027393C0D|nr:hypothetical protein [Balneatrix alpica]